jgi:small redox-active disulfide protein 2
MKIQIVGPGCPRCEATERNVFNACAELDLPADISHLRDVAQFAALGVVLTPAVLVDGKVVVAGKVPTVAALKEILAAATVA